MKNKKCDRFTSAYCVDGNCPIALAEEFPWIDSPKSCDVCCYRTGKCKDCVFLKTLYCPRTKGE